MQGYKEAEVAYGGCHFCYGKGYATQMMNEVGAEDFGGDGYEVGGRVKIRFCKCESGQQLAKLWSPK